MENVVKEHVIQEKRTSKNWGLCTVFSAWIATARMYYEIQSLLVFTLSLIFFFPLILIFFPYLPPPQASPLFNYTSLFSVYLLHLPPLQILPLLPTQTWQPCQLEWQANVYLQGNGEGW